MRLEVWRIVFSLETFQPSQSWLPGPSILSWASTGHPGLTLQRRGDGGGREREDLEFKVGVTADVINIHPLRECCVVYNSIRKIQKSANGVRERIV